MPRRVAVVGCLVVAAACEAGPPPAPSSTLPPHTTGEVDGAGMPRAGSAAEWRRGTIDARFTDAMRAAAKTYQHWGHVDDDPRLAPAPCAAAGPTALSNPVRLSAAETGPHGRKLYYLWASDRGQYLDAAAFPTGFTIVKESFEAVPGGDPASASSLLTDDGKRLSIGERKDLFVMTKVGATDGTDAGWVYGTVAVDGTVTGAGRIAACMECHDRDASHERLFGLAPAPKH